MADCVKKISLGLVLLCLAGPVVAGDAVLSLPQYVSLLGRVATSMMAVKAAVSLDSIAPGLGDTLAAEIIVIERFANKYSALNEFKTKAHWAETDVVKHDLTNNRDLNNALDGVMEILKHLEGNPSVDNSTIALRDSLHLYRLHYSYEAGMKKLQRYGKKYGPQSARLNPVDGMLNIFLLQYLPGFRPDSTGPGPLEFISAYSSSYVTAYNAETEKLFKDIGIVSALEIGVRYYFLGEGWGEEGFWKGIAKPGFATAGLLVTGEEAGFFKSPLKGKESYGLFLSWGGLKAGYIVGDNSRILLSRQFQVVPYLF